MKTVTGWIGKDHYKKLIKKPWEEVYYKGGYYELLKDIDMFQKKGKKSFWCEKSWPPVKVIITIEEEKTESSWRGVK